ncbi:MAG: tail fiber domain-containing protein [Verrucomicrobia bacterium]|nr:tail fiber domain-containing protein [Verrucomicrobiota bacterium]
MKKKPFILLALAFLSTLNSQLSTLFAQGSAFTYQGRLNTNNAPYSGSAEFQFTLWDAASAGSAVATNNPVSLIAPVADGLFTVTLDFGLNPFNGQPRFLQTEVRTAIGPFTALTPRQPVTATPYALRALNLTTNGLAAGTYASAVTFDNAANSFAGAFTGAFTGAASGNGSGLTNVNAATLGGLSGASFWKTNGNAGANPTNGAFLGTADNLPLEFKVNGQRALRIEPTATSPNVIGGAAGNSVAAGLSGATISGGSGNRILLSSDSPYGGSVIGGGDGNLIGGTPGVGGLALGGFNFIGGGYANNIRAGGDFDTISGGEGNTIGTNADHVTIAGGARNDVGTSSVLSVISGGNDNNIGTNSPNSVIGGGGNNNITNNSTYATIPGGELNTATNYAFAAGRRAKANHQGAFVWADSQNADFDSTSGDQFLIRAAGGVGIGTTSPQAKLHVAGSVVVQGLTTPPAASATNLLNLGSGNTTNGFLNGISFFESATTTAMSLGYDGSGGAAQNALRIYSSAGSPLFTFEASGDLGIGTTAPTNKLHVIGGATFSSGAGGANQNVVWTPGSASWSFTSDRNAKDRIAPVDGREVLEKLSRIPVAEWSYKGYDQRHLGPMAQDFHAQFPLNTDDTSLNDADLHGVALAAIQGLNQKLTDELKRRDAENAELKTRLIALEELIANLSAKGN